MIINDRSETNMKTARTLLYGTMLFLLTTSCTKHQDEVVQPAASSPSTTCRDHCPTGGHDGPTNAGQAKDL